MMRVAELHIYPLKSARGIALQASHAGPEGLAWDRRWMLVDRAGRFVTQRGYPSLSQVSVELQVVDESSATLVVAVPIKRGVIASQPGERVVQVPARGGTRVSVEIWGEHVAADAVSADADKLISEYLDEEVRIVAFPCDVTRPCDPTYAAPADRVAFADGFPYLVTTTASREAVSDEVGVDLPMLRFRPNIVIDGAEAWDEDEWAELTIGGRRVRIVKPCGRCAMVNVDPARGTTGREPLRILNQSRRFGNKVIFGQNAVFDDFGTVTVGDPVVVATRVTSPANKG